MPLIPSGFPQPNRRGALKSLVCGSIFFPAIVSEILAQERSTSADETSASRDAVGPLTPKQPHFAAKAKRVVFVFAPGGVSHIDTFDPKPMVGVDRKGKDGLMGCRFPIGRNPRTGLETTDLFAQLRDKHEDFCLIRSMKSAHFDHSEAALSMHTGSATFARPSIGSWMSYGLGTVNQNLPSFMVIAPHLPYGGTQIYASDFLPAYHQGTRVIGGKVPIQNLDPRGRSNQFQELELDLTKTLNERHHQQRPYDEQLAARIKSMETAFEMQTAGPEAFDLSKETDETFDLYGLERGKNDSFAWQCLIARRLAERGVRFIELVDSGSRPNWDAHSDMDEHVPLAKAADQPLAALLTDLKRRGMLDDTLVVWATEFGRKPTKEGEKGRGHHGACFSVWLAGGGVKGGIVHGATNEIGSESLEKKVEVHDLHATILHLMGIDHERLTYRHTGRDYRLTDVSGQVVHDILL